MILYNVRMFKYPHGWHVRVFSSPVGFSTASAPDVVDDFLYGDILDDDTGEWVNVRYNPKKEIIEPFTNNLAHILPEPKQVDRERSIASSMNRTKNRVYYLARSNIWDWFLTLTFDPSKVDSYNYDECVKRLKGWMDTIRRSCSGIKYIIVPEKHKSGRIHFHGLFACCEGLEFVDSGHKTSNGQTIYNVGRYSLGFSTATPIKDNSRVTQYISKYITKDLCSVSCNRKRYWASRNLDEAEIDDFLLDGSEIQKLIYGLGNIASFSKYYEGTDVQIRYYEIAPGGLSGAQDLQECSGDSSLIVSV